MPSLPNHSLFTALLLLQALCLSGCSSAQKFHSAAAGYYENGDTQQVLSSLTDAEERRGAERDLIAVDRALAHLMNGEPAACEAILRDERQRLEFLQQKDLKEETAALLTDDKAVAWTGRDFERRMIDNMLVLSSLMGNRQDAFAHATIAMDRVYDDQAEQLPKEQHAAVAVSNTEALDETIDTTPPPPARLSPNAFSSWLHAAVHSEKAMDADLTDHSLKLASYWQGEKQHQPQPLGNRTSPGHGVLNVITLADRITDWEAERAAPTSAALLIADQLLSAIGDHTLPPTIAPVAIARPLQESANVPFRTFVTTNSAPRHESRVMLDLNAAAWNSYQHHRNDQIARAVVRRIVKKGTVYAAKDQLNVSKDAGVDIVLNVAGIVWEAMEKADTRHISLLPARIETNQIELPAGQHQIRISSGTQSRPGNATATNATTVNVAIENGRNTFVIVYRSGQRILAVQKDGATALSI